MAKKIVKPEEPKVIIEQPKDVKSFATAMLIFCIVVIGIILGYYLLNPDKRDRSDIIRTILSLAVGGIVMFITGKVEIKGTIKLITFRSTGSIAAFFVVFYFLVVDKEPKNCGVLASLDKDVAVFQADLRSKITIMEKNRDEERDLDKKEKMGITINAKKKSLENIDLLLIPHIREAIKNCNTNGFDEQTHDNLKTEFNSYKN